MTWFLKYIQAGLKPTPHKKEVMIPKPLISGEVLSKVAASIKGDSANKIAGLLSSICPLYGINTPDIFHEFIANVLHESNEFKTLEEGLNYQAVALTKIFSRQRISIDDCYMYGRTGQQKANQQAIANTIYGGTWGKINLGNILPGDGYLMRGSGPIQQTGRGNITKFASYYNNKFGTKYTPEQMAELLRTDLAVGIHSACWFFAIEKKLIPSAIADRLEEIVRRINGGVLGLAKRQFYYNQAKKYIV